MESGFRRFWARRKNRSDTPQHYDLAPRTSPSVYSRPSISTADGRPSIALSSHAPDRAVSRGTTGYKHVTSENRIQPMLLGVSRPSEYVDRPGTTSSLQPPSTQAIDIGVRQSSEQWRTQNGHAEYHKQTTMPRYVDIFAAVATSVPNSYSSRYNEEIASRNLDVTRAQNGTPLRAYAPSPVSQREAQGRELRSAQQMRPSGEHTRYVSDDRRSPSFSYQIPRDINTAVSNASGTYSSAAPPSISTHVPQNDDVRHRRYVNGEVDKLPARSPIVGQTRAHENGSLSPNLTNNMIGGILPPGSRSESRDQPDRYDGLRVIVDKSAAAEPVVNSLNQDKVYDPRRYDRPMRDPISDYSLSASEASRSPQNRPPASRLLNGELRPTDRRNIMDSSIARSYNKSVQLPKRTIMDLTSSQEDTISEVSENSSTYGYGDNTPVIQQAKMGSVQRVPIQEPASADDSLYRYTQSDDLYPGSFDRSTPQPIAVETMPTKKETAPVVKQSMAFSPINMVASLSPRSSLIRLNDTSSTPISPDIPALDVQVLEDLISNSAPPAPVIVKREETPTQGMIHEDINSTESTPKAVLKTQPEPEAVTKATTVTESPSAERPNTSRKMQPFQNVAPDAVRAQQGTPSIYESPASLRSIDYTNPGESFGVRTRDFAVTSQKSSTSLKKIESSSLQKSATENAARAASAQKNLRKTPVKTTRSRAKQYPVSPEAMYSAEFDQVGFARKQAEAKAAMDRLQASLEKDFSRPLPKPIKEPKKKRSVVRDPESVSALSKVVMSMDLQPKVTPQPGTEKRSSTESRGGISFNTDRISSMSSNRSSASSKAPTRKGAPPSLKYFEAVNNSTPESPKLTSNTLLLLPQQFSSTNKPPPSPGEISLSAFPIPSSRPTSEHEPVNIPTASSRKSPAPIHERSNSFKSLSSMASQYSIPFHMIPDRHSSVRDIVTEEENGY